MRLLRQLSTLFLFCGVAVRCQYDVYWTEEDYDDDDDWPPFYSPSYVQAAPPPPGPLGCAPECSCPASFPAAMYCDRRKLKTIPTIPGHVRQLYLQFNDIEAVTGQAFANASNLREINLGHNKIRSPHIEPGIFARLPHLLQLHLDHNQLEAVPLPLPASLESLLLGYNGISGVEANALDALVNLSTLDLCHNRLRASSLDDRLSRLAGLTQLHLGSNGLASLPRGLPSSLMHLSLENNSLSRIPDDYFLELPRLLALRVSHNLLQEIPYAAFNLSSLVELNVGHNRLRRAFYIPGSLQHLYLEDNDLEHINVTLLCPSIDPAHHRQLTYIRLDQNRLQEPISSFVVFCFPHMRSIYYGEQRRPDGQTVRLRTQVFRRLQGDEEAEDEGEDGEGDEAAGQEQGWPEEALDPYFY